MGPDRARHIRNILIIVALAVVVWLVPGGGTGSSLIYNVLTLLLTAGLLFFGYRLYMENRATIFGLGDNVRAVLYGSARAGVRGAAGDEQAVERRRPGRAAVGRAPVGRRLRAVPRLARVLRVLTSFALSRGLRLVP